MTASMPNFVDSPTAPARNCFAIAVSDLADLPSVTKAIYVGSGGDIAVKTIGNDADVIFRNVPGGSILDIMASAVRQSGTTASDLVGLA